MDDLIEENLVVVLYGRVIIICVCLFSYVDGI